MPTVRKEIRVGYTPAQMFALVDNIETYPEFVPACSGTEILERSCETVRASLHFSHGIIQQSLTTKNHMIPGEQIKLTLEAGPFKYLTGSWLFEPVAADQCRIVLALDFEFANKLLGMTFGSIFNKVADKLVDVFVERAATVYPRAN